MITPNDIQEKEFARVVRGYKEDEVNAFLDLITLDMDKLIQENRELRNNIDLMKDEIERYKGSEGSIFETLETAKALMSDISASAEKRAEIVLKNAELEADRIQKDARDSVDRLNEEAKILSSRWGQFKVKYKNLLENEMERLEGLGSDFLLENVMDELRAIPDAGPTVMKTEKSPAPKLSEQDKSHTTKTIKTSKRRIGD